MNQKSESAITFISTTLLAAFACTLIFFLVKFLACFSAAGKLPEIYNYPLIRISIYGSSFENSSSTISARISFLDSDSSEFAVFERSWNGLSLSMEFLTSSFCGKTVVFPYRIFAGVMESENFDFSRKQEISRRGTKLFHYFNENGQCLLYGSRNSVQIKKSLYTLAQFALISRMQPSSKFFDKRELNFSGLKYGETYTVYTGFDGEIHLSKD